MNKALIDQLSVSDLQCVIDAAQKAEDEFDRKYSRVGDLTYDLREEQDRLYSECRIAKEALKYKITSILDQLKKQVT